MDDTNVLDDLTVLQIEMEAITVCTRRSDFNPKRAPAFQMVDDNYRAAIRSTFASEDAWEDWMVEPLLAEMKQSIQVRNEIDAFGDRLLRTITGGL